MTPPRMMQQVDADSEPFNPHVEQRALCAVFGCVPVAAPPPPMTRDALTVLRDTLDHYQRFFGVDPAALPIFEARGALAQLAQCIQAAQAVVDAYHAIRSGATLDAFSGMIHALEGVLGEGEAE